MEINSLKNCIYDQFTDVLDLIGSPDVPLSPLYVVYYYVGSSRRFLSCSHSYASACESYMRYKDNHPYLVRVNVKCDILNVV